MKTRFLLVALSALLLSACALAQLRQVAIVEIPGEPGFGGIASIGGDIVLAHSGANTLDVFNAATRRLVEQVPGMNNPRGLAVNPGAGLVYVANAGNRTVSEISTKDWSVRRTFTLDRTPEQLLLVGNRLYTANWIDGSVSVIDLPLGRVVASIDVHGSPQHMIYDKATGLVFVTLEDVHQVIALAPNGDIAKRYTLLASQPTGLALDPSARRLFVAVRYAVVILDPDTGREVARVAAPAGTNSVSFDPSTGTAFVGVSGGAVGSIRYSAGHFYYTELSTDVRGRSVAFDPSGDYLYMPGAWRGRSKLAIFKPVANPPALDARGAANAQAAPALPPPSQAPPPHPSAAELLSAPHR